MTDSLSPVPALPPDMNAPADAQPKSTQPALERHFGLFQATALNVTMIVGAGIFVTIPLMLKELPGPYAVLGWVVAGGLMLCDSLIWSELGAAWPGSGGSYIYLLNAYGSARWGRLMAFLFIWQFLISGPLEIASGLIAAAQFAPALHSDFRAWNDAWSASLAWPGTDLRIACSPARAGVMIAGVVLLMLLYRRTATLGKWTVTFWAGVMGIIVWILIEGALHFDRNRAFDFTGAAASTPDLGRGLGAAMLLAMYSYLGYYNVCYIGDEVRDPARTLPRSIVLSALLVCGLFTLVHLALVGTVSWHDIPTEGPEVDSYNLPAEFMRRIHGQSEDGWAIQLVTALLVWTCLGSAFAGLLGYSRIPYGAARCGHFFAALGRVHPVRRLPYVSLLAVGGLSLFWCFFDLASVIQAMLTTRIVAQFIAQVGAVVLMRQRLPAERRPYKMWLYPLPCALALAGWLWLFFATDRVFIQLSVATMVAGLCAFAGWTFQQRQWPFKAVP
jgi:amino acid transporter